MRIRFPSDRTLLHGQFFCSLRIVRDAMLGQALSKTTLPDSLSKRTEADDGQVLPDLVYEHNECAFVFQVIKHYFMTSFSAHCALLGMLC